MQQHTNSTGNRSTKIGTTPRFAFILKLLAPPGTLALRHPARSKPQLQQRSRRLLRVPWGRPFLVGQGWSRAWPSSAAHQSPPPSSASLASLVHFTQPQTLCGHLAKVLRLLHAQLWLRRHPALSTSHPTLTTIGTSSSTPTALLRLLTAQQPPSTSRPTPLELVGAPVTSAAAACASPSSAECGERSERPSLFLFCVRLAIWSLPTRRRLHASLSCQKKTF